MKIAVDAMGGDRGPEIVTKAAIEAAKSDPSNLTVVVVGDAPRIEAVLRKSRGKFSNIEVVHASETVGMSEPPASAIRKKKDSSIAVTLRLLKEGAVDGMVSPGNTGAVVAGSLVTLGRLHGVSRPAIATFYPTAKGWVVVLDIGANSVCTPKNLLQFGIMGSVFAQYHLDLKNPRVGLLNIGEERSKGTDIVKEAYGMLESGNVNFVGNVEGRDVFSGAADVVVCDGFVGNILLKFAESIVAFTSYVLREEIKKKVIAKLGALLMKGAFFSFRSRLDYAEYGGAPLLGVNGVVIIAHGKSSVRAIRNAIFMARRFVTFGVNRHIEEHFIETAGKVA
ncbi:MAG: phosphate acyltransferase PlsX [Candidatus Latescibacterota bacterium]|nr:MAG: phosphate acyltransferase PlsX [Candidatus Latescibacterota bacterium]